MRASTIRGGNPTGRFFRPFFCGLLLHACPVASVAELPRLAFHLESVNYSEATSLRSLSGEWDDRVGSGDDALSFSRTYLGLETDDFSIQYLQRFESLYEFDNDTAKFIYQTENRLPLTSGETYRLDIRPRRAASEGIRLGFKNLRIGQLGAAVFISLLKPFNLLDGELDGSAVATGPGDYDFEFRSDLVYKRDPLFERDGATLSGSGYAVDLHLDYALSERWHGRLELVDVAGKLSLNDAPFTTAEASSDTKTFDENGYLVYDPVVRGFEGNKDYSYEFDMQTHATISYLISAAYRFALLHHDYGSTAYQEIQLNQSFGRGLISWQLIPQAGAAGIAYLTPNLALGFAADDIDFKKMKYLALQIRYTWAF